MQYCLRGGIIKPIGGLPPFKREGSRVMDIQKIINDVVARLKAEPDLVAKFAANPVKIGRAHV